MWESIRAHLAKYVKAKRISKEIDIMVIPGDLTPYLHTGDIGIYKSFKDLRSSVIDDYKRSDRVQYIKNGNPQPSSVEEVVTWVSNSDKDVPNDVVRKSIAASGFAVDYRDWHIAKHDVYGELFLSKWVSADEESPDDADGADIADEFDDLVVE